MLRVFDFLVYFVWFVFIGREKKVEDSVWKGKGRRVMWLQKNHWDKKDGVKGIVAVAIDSDKGSQNALKWAIDHLLNKGSNVVLLHVKHKPSSLSASASLMTPSKYSLLYLIHVLFSPMV